MLKPDLFIFDIIPDIKSKLRPKIARALEKSLKELPPKKLVKGVPHLTISEAKERLEMEFPYFQPVLSDRDIKEAKGLDYDPREIGNILHRWLGDATIYFRRQGSNMAKEWAGKASKNSYPHLWRSLFDNKILALIQSEGLLGTDQAVRLADFLVECLKLWTERLADFLETFQPGKFNPQQSFLDVENELEGLLRFGGIQINLKGRPDTVFLDSSGRIILWEYKFGRQVNYETQIAQTIMYMDLLEAIKGASWQKGRLAVFYPQDDDRAPIDIIDDKPRKAAAITFPPAVNRAFEGFIGNEPALRQLKIKLSLALRRDEISMPVNIMLCGPGGLGKTEIANRTAECLGLPLVSVNAKSFNSLEKIIAQVDRLLSSHNLESQEGGMDSGAPKYVYPPLVLFLDEVHLLGKKAEEFLNLFEPKERRGVLPHKVVDFSHASILAATTAKGKLPGPFLNRFNMIDLLPYSMDEVGQIVTRFFREKGIQISPQTAESLARAGRLNPRESLNRAKDFHERHIFNNEVYPLSVVGLEHVRRDWMIDDIGLGPNDHEYLKYLADGPRGLNSLVSALPVGKEEIETVIEPFLLQLGLVRTGNRGRELTEKGRKLIFGTDQ